jgi:hypothetical protein
MSIRQLVADAHATLDAARDAAQAAASPLLPSGPTAPTVSAAPGSVDTIDTAPTEQLARQLFGDASHVGWRGAAQEGPESFAGAGQLATLGTHTNNLRVGALAGRIDAGGASIDGAVARREIIGTEGEVARTDWLSGGVFAGTHNPDGSRGIGLGAGANLVAMERSFDAGGFRVMGGLSHGVGAAASLGVRDADRDGRTEICSSLSLGAATIGTCYEPATIVEGVRAAPRAAWEAVAGALRP